VKQYAMPLLALALVVLVGACGADHSTGQHPPVASPRAYVVSTTSVSAWRIDTGARLWQVSLVPGSATPQSVLVGPTLYVADGALTAVRVADGRLLWTVALPNAAQESAPIVANGDVYVATSTELYALQATDGTLLWRYDHPLAVPALVAAGATLYLAANGVIALNASDGTKQWEMALAEGMYTTQAAQSLTLAGATLYVATQSDALFALDAQTGASKWTYQSAGGLSAPVIGSSAVFVATFVAPVVAQGAGTPTYTVLALKPSDGSMLWHTSLTPTDELNATTPAPLLMNSILYVLAGPTGGDVIALRASDGSRLWNVIGIAPGNYLVADAFGVTLVVQDGSLRRFDVTGAVLWHHDGTQGQIALVHAVPPKLYVIWQSGQFAALVAATGQMRWQETIAGGMQAPILLASGG
jgi:eukaryotic-like serine/threonine-protein kinase